MRPYRFGYRVPADYAVAVEKHLDLLRPLWAELRSLSAELGVVDDRTHVVTEFLDEVERQGAELSCDAWEVNTGAPEVVDGWPGSPDD